MLVINGRLHPRFVHANVSLSLYVPALNVAPACSRSDPLSAYSRSPDELTANSIGQRGRTARGGMGRVGLH